MILSPSTRLLIHILAVFCLAYRVVLSQDADLLAAVVASNAVDDAGAAGDTKTTTADPTTTIDDSTTDSEMNTTESIISTSTAGNILCVPSNSKDSCVLEGTTDKCDPCGDGYVCEDGNFTCSYTVSTCTATCTTCADEELKNEKGVCVDRICNDVKPGVCSLEDTKLPCDPCVGRPDCAADMYCLANNVTCGTTCECSDNINKMKSGEKCIDRQCKSSNKNDKKCLLEGTQTECDPCKGITCDKDKKCLSDVNTCATQCVCTDEVMTPNTEGVCTKPCDAKPCQNGQKCQSDITVPSKFVCQCTSDYDGEFCENIHNYCKDEHPVDCPLGAFECKFNGVGDYTCSCAGGHSLDNATNTCTKVTERLTVDLIFSGTFYSEAYNVEGTPERKMATDNIEAAMKDLYGTLLISISYAPFTQGSLVAHYSMDMKMAPNGDPEKNANDFKKYSTNCETDNELKKTCFGALGKPHVPQNGTISEDLRCDDVYCPAYTQCEPIDLSDKSVRCVCMPGFKLVKTVVEDTGRPIEVCEEIDLCKQDKSPCNAEQMCIPSPGSFECVGSPCEKNPCPGNAVCNAIDHYAYDCQCDWIYIASDCGTPWPLILVIVSSVLLALLILAIIGLIILFSRSKKGSSVIDTTSF